jgi:dihydropteroate synthase
MILQTINCRGILLDISTPVVMGILNITPDSFYDGGKFNEENDRKKKVEKMLTEGASIIDIGGVSSRPGAADVSEEEEWHRLAPVLQMMKKDFPEALLSVDTTRASIAKMALQEGTSVINDISAGSDPEMMQTVAAFNAPYIIMHMQGDPSTMQIDPHYDNVTGEVLDFLAVKIDLAKKAGIKDIIIDPGFGFGKTVEHNFQLLKNLKLFGITECPVLAGLSRKSMINKILKTKPETALNGTTVLNTMALMEGASILRVHDVKEAAEAIRLFEAFQKG